MTLTDNNDNDDDSNDLSCKPPLTWTRNSCKGWAVKLWEKQGLWST